MYALFGAGTLVGRGDWLSDAEPYLAGGGATADVTVGSGSGPDVPWCALPGKHEARSPNVIGVHALAAACDALTKHGWDALIAHERVLAERLREGIAALRGNRPADDVAGPGERGCGVVRRRAPVEQDR